MNTELDWDTVDSGRLHWAASRAKTLSGKDVIVGVLSDPSMLNDAINDAEEERRHEQLPGETPFWLYVPHDLKLDVSLPGIAIIKRIDVT
jgi:hypothetical protein